MDARRHHPAVQEAADRAIMRLRSLSKVDQGISIELLRPFLLALSISSNNRRSSPKLISLSLSGLQRLLAAQIVDVSQLVNVTRVLLIQADTNKEEIKIKILQTLPLVMTSKAFDVDQELIAQALRVCFALHASSSPKTLVCHTTEATMRQMISMLFDHVEEGSLGLTVMDEKSPSVRGAYLLFQDLCMLGSGGDTIWLREGRLDRVLVLELIESTISRHHSLFHTRPEFKRLLKLQLCPMIMNSFSKIADFPSLVRMMRICVAVLCKYGDVSLIASDLESLYSLMKKFISREGIDGRVALESDPMILEWRRTLALETILQWTTQPDLLQQFCFAEGSDGINSTSVSLFQSLNIWRHIYLISCE